MKLERPPRWSDDPRWRQVQTERRRRAVPTPRDLSKALDRSLPLEQRKAAYAEAVEDMGWHIHPGQPGHIHPGAVRYHEHRK